MTDSVLGEDVDLTADVEQPKDIVQPVAEPEKEKPNEQAKPEKTDYEAQYKNMLAALQEERRAKKQLEEEASQIRARFSEIEQYKKAIDDHRKQAAEEKAAKELQENPAGFLKQRQDEILKELEAVKTNQTQTVENYQREQAFKAAVTNGEETFKSQTPDYIDALTYARDRRMAEYEVLGIPPEHREAVFMQERVTFAAQQLQLGRNPAESAYKLAETWGYKKKTEKQDSESKLDKIEKGQQAAKTLSKGTQKEDSVLKKLEDMSDEELDAMWNDMAKHARGGRRSIA